MLESRILFYFILFEKGLQQRCFPVNFAKFIRTPFLELSPVAASGNVLRPCILVSNRNSFLAYRIYFRRFPTPCKFQKFSDGFEGHLILSSIVMPSVLIILLIINHMASFY